VGGANLAAQLIGGPFERNTSLGEVDLAMEEEEEEEDNDKEEEGMQCRQDLLRRRQRGLVMKSWRTTKMQY
jgi:hypothetical protein